MAYYYYYQQQNNTPDPLSPATTSSELTPLLLIPQAQQSQLPLPLLTPVIPPVTSVPIKTTDDTTEHNQQQLPTPNTFIRFCEDMGLFHDLQNIVVMSSLTGQPADTATTTIPVSTTTTLVTTSTTTGQPSTSNVCSSSTTAIVTTMMMANPFDETFKQAVLQQQKNDANLSENHFDNNNNDGDLNTPFITTTSVVDTSDKKSTLSMTTPVDMTKTVVDDPASIESMVTNMTTQPQQQNMLISTSSTEISTGNVLVMMVEQQHQQQHNPIVSIQPQHQHIIEQRRSQQRFIIPAAPTTTDSDGTTTMADGVCYDDDGGNLAISGLSEITTIKQTLKQNLLVKQLMQGQQNSLMVEHSQNQEQEQQPNNDIDGFITTDTIQENEIYNNNSQVEDSSKNQLLKKKQKQELLERNRSAAKRCRMKRKQRWELLSEENRKLKLENSKLRDTITNLLSRHCANLSQ